MTASLDRAVFFDRVRKPLFGGSLTAEQVQGMDAIFDACPAALPTDPLAYVLATTIHETARTMQPIEEYGRGKGRAYGKTGFWGRGFVQLTWDYNYRKATTELRKLGVLTAAEDLVKTPALAMRMDAAATILFHGMISGWFTGKKLSDYCLTAILAGEENIREVIAYPKTQSGADPLTNAPARIDEHHLTELGLRILPPTD